MTQSANALVVEDEQELIDMLSKYLGERGLVVASANSGEDAIRYCLEFLPHIVLLDVTLPDIDGFEVCSRLRRQPRTAHIPIIFLTNRTRRSDRLAALNLGADDYITKPFDLRELYLRVRNAVDHVLRENTTDPLTGLPTGSHVLEQLRKAAAEPRLAVGSLTFQHAGPFRDKYGPLAFSDIRRYLTGLIIGALNDMGAPEDFVGILDQDTYIFIGPPGRIAAVGQHAVATFNPTAHKHYAMSDLEENAFDINGLRIPIMQLSFELFIDSAKADFIP